MNGSPRALDRLWRIVPALLPAGTIVPMWLASMSLQVRQGRTMERGVLGVCLGRGWGSTTAKPKQTKVRLGTGHRWLKERPTPAREACGGKGS